MRIVWPEGAVNLGTKRLKLPGVKLYVPCPGCGEERCLDLAEGFYYPSLGCEEIPVGVFHCITCEDNDIETGPGCDPGYFSTKVTLRLSLEMTP